MGKYKEAYLEACQIMIKESKHCQMLKEVTGINPCQLKCERKSEEAIEDKEEAKDEDSEEDD